MKKGMIIYFLLICHSCFAEDGYRLWLRYNRIQNTTRLLQYSQALKQLRVTGNSGTLRIAKKELMDALQGLLGKNIKDAATATAGTIHLVVKDSAVQLPANLNFDKLGREGFSITTTNGSIFIAAHTDIGVLYGTYHFLRLLQTGHDISDLSISSNPKISNRVLNHWDNLNRYVERGYAGISIWNWHTLPGYIDQRYIDYARANASIGINGTVLTNVNANAVVLTPMYLQKVKAIAEVLRPYGIRVYLTARFSAPVEIGNLKTADPLDTSVQRWWRNKAAEIYALVPDFGGFLVKANSEGQPGPQNYGRNHADGANMLADAVAPFGGLVMWRAFVYSHEVPDDRVKQAYNEFKPLDGTFRKNVMVQVKNGPLDFQPREPFHPLFGAMPGTPLMMEFQITQEYLGQGTQLVYEAPLFQEVLDADTWQKGKGTLVKNIIDGTAHKHALTGIAGVSNIGNERNWTGHIFGQANWYAFGRLAWDHSLGAEGIAEEWILQTFGAAVLQPVQQIMMASYETVVRYMTPLGLHHIMGTGHHYGPAPWIGNAGRADWNPVYYHRADSFGIGFDRTASGSNAVAQYAPEVKKQFEDRKAEKFLLWFHHAGWNERMQSGRTLWEELCHVYYAGVDSVRAMQKKWNALEGKIDEERFRQVQMLLAIQVDEAVWWRNACLLYFQTFSGKPIPPQYEQPKQTLAYYQALRFPLAPGN